MTATASPPSAADAHLYCCSYYLLLLLYDEVGGGDADDLHLVLY